MKHICDFKCFLAMEDEKGEGKVGDRGEGCGGIHKEEILELSNKVTLSRA